MSKAFKLARVIIKSAPVIAGKFPKSNKRGKASGTFALFLVLAFLVAAPMTFLTAEATKILGEYNAADALLTIGLPFFNLIVVTFCVFFLISTFFFSEDDAILLSLPFKPREILIARFIVTLYLSYLTIGIFILPLLLGYGIGANAGFLYYILALIQALIIPVVPLAIILLICSLVFRSVNIGAKKNMFTYILSFAALAVSLGVNIALQNAMSSLTTDPVATAETLQNLTKNVGPLLLKIMPNVYFGVVSLTASDAFVAILNSLISVVIALAVLLIVVAVCAPLYFKILQSASDKPRKKNDTDETKPVFVAKRKSSFVSQIKTEWRLIIRAPAFVVNLLLPSLLIPLMFFFILLGDPVEAEETVKALEESPFSLSLAAEFTLFTAILLFLASANGISATAVSRMGKSASFIKSIPAKLSTIVYAKTFWGVVVNLGSVLLALLLFVLLKITSVGDALVLFIVQVPIVILTHRLAFILDAKRPRLEWVTETQSVKQNTNAMIYMFGIWIIAAVLIAVSFLFRGLSAPVLGYVVAAMIFLLAISADLLLTRYLRKREYDFFDRIG